MIKKIPSLILNRGDLKHREKPQEASLRKKNESKLKQDLKMKNEINMLTTFLYLQKRK